MPGILRVAVIVLFFVAALPACGSHDGAASPPPGHATDGSVSVAPTCTVTPTVHKGEGTYYTFADGSGNCMFPATPDDLDIGAMNHADYANSAACGMCAHVVGAKGELNIRIVDQCPECPAGNIDFSPSAFAKLDDIEKGRIPITWTYVACAVTGPIIYHFKDGSSEWWTAVQIRNHRYGIAKFEYRDDRGSWVDVPRVDYNYFLQDSGMGPGPYAFRVTDVNGAVLEDTGVPLVENGDSVGTNQFPACSTP
jgi:expansin